MNFKLFSPTDFRYTIKDLEDYLTEEAFTKYEAKIEVALARTFMKYSLCSFEAVKEIEKSVEQLSTEEIYAEENRIKHDIRALVNVIKRKVNESTKPYIHATATSYDIIDTARPKI